MENQFLALLIVTIIIYLFAWQAERAAKKEKQLRKEEEDKRYLEEVERNKGRFS